MEDFEKALRKACRLFNKYRSPEAKAKIVSFNNSSKTFLVSFEGTFCRTCGFYDYFDDFTIFLEDLGFKSKRKRIEEKENGALVEFELIKE
ncbi:MAG: hypothetical protein ACP5H3_01230 [Candidatus Aenigmatarchaeota archaeon]|jgi:superoxide reductase